MRRIICIALLLPVLGACSQSPEVTAGGEVLVGELLEESAVAVFRGIPFAKPPVGALRWQRPQPMTNKLARRDATSFAPACMQSPRMVEWYRDLAETFGASRDVFDDLDVSEDCLYLNVWTPAPKVGANLPVLVYIHGGSNSSGWSYEPNYHGHVLAEKGAVVVSIAYRLGVFGFFSHPEIDAANFGLWDQVAALEWVRDNIAGFGGDPGRVMVFGESAGAQDVLALMAADIAKPLFHSAVMQSTAGFGIGRRSAPTLEDEQARGEQTAALFGFNGEGALEQLRGVPADELFRVYDEQPEYYYHSPAVDGTLLDRSVWNVIHDDELSDIPFIIGTNADEYYDSTPADVTREDVATYVDNKHFLNTPEVLAVVAGESDPREAIDRVDSAESMLCPSLYLAARQTAHNGNGWFYYFSRVRDGAAGREVRAYHGAELPYAFGTHDAWMTTTDADWALTEQMMQYWINIAANGDPNGAGLPDWPAFIGSNGKSMIFGDTARLAAPPEPGLCRIFMERIDGSE